MKLNFHTRLIMLLAGLALIVLSSPGRPLFDPIGSQESEGATLPDPLSDPSATPFSLGGSSVESHTSPNTGAAALERQFSPMVTQIPASTSPSALARTPASTQKLEAPTGNPVARQPAVYSISGRVVDINDRPIANVQLLTGAAYSATTDASGNFSLTHLAAATYTLTPTKLLFSFSPTSRTVKVPASIAGLDFVVAPDIGFRPERDGYSFNNPGQARPDCSDL